MTTPIKSIRLKCLDCCCGSSYEVSKCLCVECSLYAYRFGKRPRSIQISKKISEPLSKPSIGDEITVSQGEALDG
ncbi:MAG: hypothetical protein KKF50_02235 [Nanoarchaeota archaeon]|nr:hypothetical protein [Nanoarchaeota archaeon]